MADFLTALGDPLNTFLRYSLAAGLVSSVCFGVVGTYVVARKISYIAGAIAHCALGGVGAALYASEVLGWTWCDPILGALVVALLSAVVMGIVRLSGSEREDTIIGALWAGGMAIGLLFIYELPRSSVNMATYLFGDITIVSKTDIAGAALLALAVLVVSVLYHNRFVAISFDEDFARTRGLRVDWIYLLLLALTAVTVVLLVRIVGMIMVIALLTLPPAIASRFAGRFWKIMALATLFCMAFTVSGLALSYEMGTLTGPTIIVVASAVYFVILIGGKLWPRRGDPT